MRIYILKIILLTLFCFYSRYTYAQLKKDSNYRLVVTLHNAPFNNLSLLDYTNDKNIYIEGDHIGQFKWEFTIADSTILNSEYMMLFVPNKDKIANSYHQVRFFRKIGSKTNSIVNIGVQDQLNYIEAEYIGQTLYEKENISKFSNSTDSTTIGNLISNDFNLIVKDDSSDISIRSVEPNFSWFINFDNNNRLTYEEHLQLYINLSKKNPDSRYLLTYLALNLNNFKTRKDVKLIYENFSDKHKFSKWSKRIEHYLSGNFVNSSLVNLDAKQLELIVEDDSKYNLITFSASWCGPCIQEIPLLKTLYKDLKKYLNFTYVSIDEQKDLKAFQELAKEHKFPWRSLYAYRDLEKIKDLYFVITIPHSVLVYPNGKMETVDIRNEATQKRLKSLVLNPNLSIDNLKGLY